MRIFSIVRIRNRIHALKSVENRFLIKKITITSFYTDFRPWRLVFLGPNVPLDGHKSNSVLWIIIYLQNYVSTQIYALLFFWNFKQSVAC